MVLSVGAMMRSFIVTFMVDRAISLVMALMMTLMMSLSVFLAVLEGLHFRLLAFFIAFLTRLLLLFVLRSLSRTTFLLLKS